MSAADQLMAMIRLGAPVEKIGTFCARHSEALEWIRTSRDPLHWAVVLHPEAVPFLIKLGADIESRSETGMTVLMRACTCRRKQLVPQLIVSGASVNATCDEGESALSVCCKLKHFAEALLLIEHGANLDIRNKQGRSLVQLATITWTLYEEQGAYQCMLTLLYTMGAITCREDLDVAKKTSFARYLILEELAGQAHLLRRSCLLPLVN